MFMRMVYDEGLAQAAYLIGCQRTGEAIVIDPERDVDRYIDLARAHGLRLTAVAETHIHADFLSGARELAERVNARVYVSGEGAPDWTSRWLTQRAGGGEYDHRVLHHGDRFRVGNIGFQAVHTPGHTPEHLSFLVTDHGSGATEPIGLITGDFVFVGDLGRPDLLETAAGQHGAMEPAARRLHASARMLDTFPDFVQVWPGHGAGSACGKALGAVPMSTIGYERRFNPALRLTASEDEFVASILAGQPEPPVYFARMKRDNARGPRVLGALPRPDEIDAPALAALDGRRSAIIDTRDWDAFRAGHIAGSLSLPLGASFATDAGSLVNEDEPIYLVVEPARLDEAVRLLVRIGLDEVRGWCPPATVAAAARAGRPLTQIPQVEVEKAEEMIDAGRVRVLDVRRAAEFAEGHIEGATNIAHTRLAVRMDEVPQGDLLVHCRSGQRSARAASYLARQGRRVINLRGGYMAWAEAHQTTTP